jgi:hypothetical protein
MPEEYKLGVFALACVAGVAWAIGWLGGPVWYAVGPALIYLAYFIKLKVRRLRDKPLHIVVVLTVVSLAMVGFAVL